MGSDWRPFIYGGIASIVAEFGTFPIDTAKTRLQVQGQTLDAKFSELKYRGMTDCFLKIYREEGFKALYSGISPAILRQATYGTLKFGTYYTLKKKAAENGFLHDPNTGKEYVWGNVLCAVIAGATSSAIANPTDVLKVRMQVHGKGSSNLGMWGCFREIYAYEGVRGLWRGVGPTAQRALVIAAVELPVYDFCKLKLMNAFGDQVTNHFISSFIASLGSAIASTPIDVIRTRLMNQKRLAVSSTASNVQRIYTSSFDCAIQAIRSEGFFALYKGFIPAWIRMGPWNVIFFITYEQLKKI